MPSLCPETAKKTLTWLRLLLPLLRPPLKLKKSMNGRVMRIVERVLVCAGILVSGSALQNAVAQDASNLPYMNPQLAPEQRATDLVRRMTLAEKASEMQNNSAAVPRLSIPVYQWWSEAPHGVINEGVTEYPEPIGLAATISIGGGQPKTGAQARPDISTSMANLHYLNDRRLRPRHKLSIAIDRACLI